MSTLFLLDNNQILDLYEIKLSDFEGYFRFHGSKNLNKDLVFKGYSYLYIPCEMSNLEYNSEGKQNRPTFSISNINNYVSNLIKDRNDLIGKRLYRKKVLAKDLDDENFGGPNKNTLGDRGFIVDFVNVDTFVINKKSSEDKNKVDFILSNILDIDGLTVPSRKVYNDFCPFQYRGSGCNYGKILNYDGPVIVVDSGANDSLANAINASNNNLEDNLIIWLDSDSGSKTYGSELTVKGNRLPDGINLSRLRNELYVPEENNWRLKRIGIKEEHWKYVDPLATFVLGGSDRSFAGIIAGPLGGLFGLGKKKKPKFYMPGIKGDQVLTWTNKAGDINTGGSPAAENIVTLNNKPLKFSSSYRDALDGVYFVGSRGMEIDYDFTSGSEYSIFCVYRYYPAAVYNEYKTSEMKLLKSGPNWHLGDKYNNSRFNSTETMSDRSLDIYGFKCAYATVGDNSTSHQYFMDGVDFSTLLPSPSGDDSRPTVNLAVSGVECVIYEIIILDKKLELLEYKNIYSYLARKYPLRANPFVTGQGVQKSSKEFFVESGFENTNLGIPIADENDKLFYKSDLDARSYNIEASLLSYRGDYNSKTSYKKGDFVRVPPQLNFEFSQQYSQNNNEPPSRYFICINDNGALNLNPLFFSNVWVEDKCGKKLKSCLLRFNNGVPIPFGGFPGTVPYEYKLPGA